MWFPSNGLQGGVVMERLPGISRFMADRATCQGDPRYPEPAGSGPLWAKDFRITFSEAVSTRYSCLTDVIPDVMRVRARGLRHGERVMGHAKTFPSGSKPGFTDGPGFRDDPAERARYPFPPTRAPPDVRPVRTGLAGGGSIRVAVARDARVARPERLPVTVPRPSPASLSCRIPREVHRGGATVYGPRPPALTATETNDRISPRTLRRHRAHREGRGVRAAGHAHEPRPFAPERDIRRFGSPVGRQRSRLRRRPKPAASLRRMAAGGENPDSGSHRTEAIDSPG